MRIDLRYLVKQFHELPKDDQDSLIKDLYSASSENKMLITNRLTGRADFSDLIHKMERETLGKVYRQRIPGTPNGSVVNKIIASAKKASAPFEVMMQLEQLAYRGFIEFLNEYGGGPDSFLDLGPKHLEAYLILVRDHYKDSERQDRYDEVKNYLEHKDNMITDYTDEAFEAITNGKVRRY